MSKLVIGNVWTLLVMTSLPGALSCPDLWVTVGDSCYETSTDAMTWYQAEEFCAMEGGYLIEIHDEDEQVSLLSFLPSGLHYWIGLTDLANEGIYKWQTGYDEAEYTFWQSNQPNGDYDQNCVAMCPDDTWQWCDFECNINQSDSAIELHALCERANK